MEVTRIEASDGIGVRALLARPDSAPKGCVLVVPEVHGISDAVRWALAHQFAAAGYLAIAPASLDRIEPELELAYTREGTTRGHALADRLGAEAVLRDLQAAREQLADGLPCGLVGYGRGGALAGMAGARLGLPAVAYYPEPLPESPSGDAPGPPLMLHVGERDPRLPIDAVRRFSALRPDVPCHLYPAGEGFNRHGHREWHEDSARTALARTLAFFLQHLNDG
jgi:carboxymethylenebutenolidase